MKDKEKQLVNEIKQDFKMHEEKHKQFEETIKEIAECNKESCKDCKIICTYFYAIKKFCEIFLPEDSVVLSREEYELLKNNLDKGNYGEFESGFSQGYEKGSKETVEKILRELYSEATSNVIETVELTTFQIEQLAKQFGLEIKE